MGKKVKGEHVRLRQEFEKKYPGAPLEYDRIKSNMLVRYHLPETADEMRDAWATLKQSRDESMRDFLIKVDNQVSLLSTKSITLSDGDLVYALKSKCLPAIVDAVRDLPDSENQGDNVSWWREHLVKHDAKRKKEPVGLNLLGNDGGGGGRKPVRGGGTWSKRKPGARGKGKGGGKGNKGRYPGTEIIKEAQGNRNFVKQLHMRGTAEMQALWNERVQFEDGGGKPADRPELYKHDVYKKVFQSDLSIMPGYPVPLCVICGGTNHNAAQHRERSA